MAPEPQSPYDQIAAELRPLLAEFARARSMAALRALPSYQRVAERVGQMLASLEEGDFRPPVAQAKAAYRVVTWNIERGTQLAGQVEALRSDAYLRETDVLLLIEADIGMARSSNANVTRSIARTLGFQYVFAPCYLSLVKGSGVEREVADENRVGLHGNAVLSHYPIEEARSIALPSAVDLMRGQEKRLGSQTALAARIRLPQMALTAVSVHLDAHSTQRHRHEQMGRILDALPDDGPAVLGGDWNTSTYNTSHAFPAIVGFWRRVFMGVDYTIRNHYLRPEGWFERALFRMLESRGFDYRGSNAPGERTTFYDSWEPRACGSLGEWVPGWCFPFMRWALREHEGKCPFKLDWLATRGLRTAAPRVVHDYGTLSDHDPVGVDLVVP